jgi:hypothetical protein
LLLVVVASAIGSSIIVESRSVYDGNSSSAGVFLQNDSDVRSVGIKLVVRDQGTYPSALGAEFVPGARLDGHLTAIWFLNYYDNEDGTCKDGQPGGFGTISGGGSGLPNVIIPSPSDPDAFLFSRSYIVPPAWPAGDDGFPDGTPSIRVNFTCPSGIETAGDFLIDTTCVNPAGHTLFVLTSGTADPNLSFTAGTITCEPCDCQYQGDYDADGFITPTDLSAMIDILYAGSPDVQDAGCPRSRTDLNCDGFPMSLDLAIMVDHLYADGPGPCDPCAP